MRILLAVDGSPNADMAAAVVAATRWPTGTTLRAVSVLPRSPLAPLDWFGPSSSTGDEPDPDAHYRDAIDRAASNLRTAGWKADSVLLTGRPASAIVEEAGDFLADLVVVGSRGHGPWESLVLGSVSAEVVDHAPCPVLVIRTPILDPIVLAHDDSPSAHRAEDLLAGWPIPSGARLTVLTVAEQPTALAPLFGTGMSDEMAQWYAYDHEASLTRSRRIGTAAADRLRAMGLSVSAELSEGEPAAAIVARATQLGAGLIVLGTRGHGGVARLLLGSVARNVLFHAPCSILVVRPQLQQVGPGSARRETREPAGAR